MLNAGKLFLFGRLNEIQTSIFYLDLVLQISSSISGTIVLEKSLTEIKVPLTVQEDKRK